MAPKAIQFGAGNIGRGFSAQLFTESGYEVVFVDVVDEVVQLINERKSYPVEIVGDGAQTVIIRHVRAVDGKDKDAVAQEIMEASLVCTAVGVNVLRHVAPSIALGIKLRADAGISEPLNIIICENLLNASDILRNYILAQLPPEYEGYVRSNIGFVESVVSRMVPVMTAAQRERDPLLVVVEAYKKLPVDRRGFIGEIPDVVGFQPYDNFEGYVERKLFTHNLGHAASAYLGRLRGHSYIWQAIADPIVNSAVKEILVETGKALIEKWGFTQEQHQEHIDDLLNRFGNVALGDTVARVGRDPIRKLGPNDRIIGGAKLAVQYGISPEKVSFAAAAALMYDEPNDPASVKLQAMIQEEGVKQVLQNVSGIDPESELATMIIDRLNILKSGRWQE